MRELTACAAAEEAGLSLRSFLKRRWGLADSLISHLKFVPGSVTVNDRPARMCDRLFAGDAVSLRMEEAAPRAVRPVAVPLDILWEDEDLLILNKPSGMAVHGAEERGGCTVANALAAYWGPDRVFHPVNRLDKGTSGAMAVAKSRLIHDRLRRMLHTPDFRRIYLAVTVGVPRPAAGRIDLPIGRPAEDSVRRAVMSSGAAAATDYRVLSDDGCYALTEVRPLTGRTHQIRVHFSALGCPLAGDWLYGSAAGPFQRPALHSWKMELLHPVTGMRITAEAPLPEDLREFAADRGWLQERRELF